jgi:hypothetical protein
LREDGDVDVDENCKTGTLIDRGKRADDTPEPPAILSGVVNNFHLASFPAFLSVNIQLSSSLLHILLSLSFQLQYA